MLSLADTRTLSRNVVGGVAPALSLTLIVYGPGAGGGGT